MTKLTMSLVRESVLVKDTELYDDDNTLLKTKVLRLDWLGIIKMENLDAFTNSKELYQYVNIYNLLLI